jgi:hypothetical protein
MWIAAAALVATLTMGACGDSVSVDVGGAASVRVLLTDAPIDYVQSAMVDIGAVVLVPADGGAHIVLSEDGTDGPVNLLDLRNSATMLLADEDIEAGSYSQLRLIVESASVELIDGYTFVDGSTVMDLKVPSGAQTGIKLNLRGDEGADGPLDIVPGDMVLVVDFDVSRSFVIQGNPETPAGIKSMSFKPTLRVVVNDVAGSISGTVSTAVDGVSVESLTVTAEPVEDGALEEYQTRTATTMTAEDGTYTLGFLVPGTYTVTVTPPDDTVASDPASVEVVVGENDDVTEIDFSLVE